MVTKYIYKLMNNEEAVQSSTFDVLRSFEEDGVMHLELRTTPRVSPGTAKQPGSVRDNN
jgi:adenosine deaminase